MCGWIIAETNWFKGRKAILSYKDGGRFDVRRYVGANEPLPEVEGFGEAGFEGGRISWQRNVDGDCWSWGIDYGCH